MGDRAVVALTAVLLGFGLVLVAPPAQGQDLEPLVPERQPGGSVTQTSESMAKLEVGVNFAQRSFTLDSRTAGLELVSSLYPTFYLGAEFFPVARDTRWWSRLGLRAAFARGQDTTVIDEGGVERRVPTRHSELDLAAVYRQRVSPELLLEGGTGVQLLNFVLAENPFYSSTQYRAWQFSARGVYTVTPWLDLVGGFKVYPLVGLGGSSEAEFGQDSSTFGGGATLAAEATAAAGLYVHAGYTFRAFSTSFSGLGDRQLEAVVTTDIVHTLSVWAGYRF